jgi:multidrug efflux pump subunit AcrA (membrane-fusion protein)
MAMNLAAHSARAFSAVLLTVFCCVSPCFAADEEVAPKGAAVTVLKAARHCFDATVEVSGILIAKDETMVRPDRPGLKVAEVLVDAGETVAAGQPLARLTPPEGGTITMQAPVAGLVSTSSAVTGAIASPRGEALFSIVTRSEFDLAGLVPARELPRLAVDQAAAVQIVGAGEVRGKVRRVAATVEPNTQLGQVFVALSSSRRLLANSSGRAIIKTGAELRSVGAVDRDPVWQRGRGGAGGAARPRRNPAGPNRADVGGRGRNPRGACRRRHCGGARRRAAARR